MLNEEQIEERERQFPETAGVAFAEAYRRTLAAGLSVLVSDDGFIFEVYPDGTRKRIKRIEAPMMVVKGSRLEIGQ